MLDSKHRDCDSNSKSPGSDVDFGVHHGRHLIRHMLILWTCTAENPGIDEYIIAVLGTNSPRVSPLDPSPMPSSRSAGSTPVMLRQVVALSLRL